MCEIVIVPLRSDGMYKTPYDIIDVTLTNLYVAILDGIQYTPLIYIIPLPSDDWLIIINEVR